VEGAFNLSFSFQTFEKKEKKSFPEKVAACQILITLHAYLHLPKIHSSTPICDYL